MEVETHRRFEVPQSAQRDGCCPGGSGVETLKSLVAGQLTQNGFRGSGKRAVQVRKLGPVGELAIAFGIKDLDGLNFSAGDVSSSLTPISPRPDLCTKYSRK